MRPVSFPILNHQIQMPSKPITFNPHRPGFDVENLISNLSNFFSQMLSNPEELQSTQNLRDSLINILNSTSDKSFSDNNGPTTKN